MAVEVDPVYRQGPPVAPEAKGSSPPLVDTRDQPDYLALLKRGEEKTYSITPLLPSLEKRPLEPLEASPPRPEPEYGSVTAKEWELWVGHKEAYAIYIQKRDIARTYEAENSLRGTF